MVHEQANFRSNFSKILHRVIRQTDILKKKKTKLSENHYELTENKPFEGIYSLWKLIMQGKVFTVIKYAF